MAWSVLVTDEFEAWISTLDDATVEAVRYSVRILGEVGPTLGRPYVDTVNGSAHANLKELRVQAKGKPVRVFFAFDSTRTAVLLNGGEKTSDERFYLKMIAKADSLFADHLTDLEQ